VLKKRTFFVILVFSQLIIFVTPLFIKGTHIHSYENDLKHSTGNSKSIAKAEQWCPIYKYEFVNLISHDEIQSNPFQQTAEILYFGLIHQIFKISFTSCLLRAPPVSY
jgi:hypothetical protein